MFVRVAISELFRDSPTAVRCHWAFRDFISAHVVIDVAEAEHARAEAEAPRGGARG